jgi:hypothetical protein
VLVFFRGESPLEHEVKGERREWLFRLKHNAFLLFCVYYLDGAEGQKMIKKIKKAHFFAFF